MSTESSFRAIGPHRAATALLVSITAHLRQLEARADLHSAKNAASDCAILARTIGDRPSPVRRLAHAIETITANIRDGRAPCGSGLARALVVAAERLGAALGSGHGPPDERAAESALSELTDALSSASDPTRSNWFLGPRVEYPKGVVVGPRSTVTPPPPARVTVAQAEEPAPGAPALPQPVSEDARGDHAAASAAAEPAPAALEVAPETTTVLPEERAPRPDESNSSWLGFDFFLPPVEAADEGEPAPETAGSEATTAPDQRVVRNPPVEDVPARQLPSGFTTAVRTERPLAGHEAPPTPSVPVIRPEALSIEQLLDEVDVIRAQKAELDKQEKALLKVLRKKTGKVRERIAGLYGDAPADGTTGGRRG